MPILDCERDESALVWVHNDHEAAESLGRVMGFEVDSETGHVSWLVDIRPQPSPPILIDIRPRPVSVEHVREVFLSLGRRIMGTHRTPRTANRIDSPEALEGYARRVTIDLSGRTFDVPPGIHDLNIFRPLPGPLVDVTLPEEYDHPDTEASRRRKRQSTMSWDDFMKESARLIENSNFNHE